MQFSFLSVEIGVAVPVAGHPSYSALHFVRDRKNSSW